MKRIALVALVLVGCSRKAQSACEQSIGGALDRALTAEGEVPDAITEMKQKMTAQLTQLCQNDQWSPDVLACLDDATSPAAAKACEAKLTPAQTEKLEKSMGEVMGLPIADKK
jgi:hypothetical protein